MLPSIAEIALDPVLAEQVIEHLDGLVKESSDGRAPWEQVVEDSINLFVYGDVNPPREEQIVIPEIQNAVVAICETQLRQPASPVLEPVETGEPGEFYWAGPQDAGIRMGLPIEYVAGFLSDPLDSNSYQDPLPLPTELAEQLKALAMPPELAPALPPGAVRPDWIVELDDRLVAETAQQVFDVLWARSGIDAFNRDLLYETNIQGTAYGLYEFDDKAKRHITKHLSFTQVHFDPTARKLKDAAYAGFDLPMDFEEAMSMYPHLAEVIDAEAQEGTTPENPWGSSRMGEQWNRTLYRKHVTISVWWIRNQLLPMSEEEVVQSGAVVQQEVADEFPELQAEEEDTAGEPAPDPASGILEDVKAGVQSGNPADDEGDGAAVGAEAAPIPGTPAPSLARLAYILPDAGAEVAPGGPGWPEKRGIRQLTIIAKRLVDDRESEFRDIPIIHAKNIPLPGARPYGMGEPMRLRTLQRALSRNVDAMVTQSDFNAFPLVTMSEGMKKLLPKEYQDGRVRPGMTITVPDALYRELGGKVETVHDAPALSQAAVELTPMLKQFIQESSGNTPVMRGISPSANASGTMVDLLQTAGAAMMGFKAQGFGDTIQYLAEEMLHSQTWRLEVEDVAKIVSKYRECPHILEKIWARCREMDWNVSVKIEAGAGTRAMQKRQTAQIDMQVGALSLQTYCEQVNIDYRVERQRILSHQQWLSTQMGAMMPQQEGEPGEEKGNGQPKQQQPAA